MISVLSPNATAIAIVLLDRARLFICGAAHARASRIDPTYVRTYVYARAHAHAFCTKSTQVYTVYCEHKLLILFL